MRNGPHVMSMKARLAGAFCALALGSASVASYAQPKPTKAGPSADLLVIHATDCATPTVDPRIGEAPPLKYRCYALVEKKELALVKGQPVTTALPNGRTFQLTLTDILEGQRMKLAAAISQPDQKGFMTLANITAEPNKQFHVGGFAHQGGALVLGIRVHP